MDDTRIQIQSPEQFEAAMGSIQSALALLGTFDWQHLVDQVNLLQMLQLAEPDVCPGVIQSMEDDPQWEQKMHLFTSTAQFLSEIASIKKELRP